MNWLASALAAPRSDYCITLLTLAGAEQDCYETGAGVSRVVALPQVSSSCRWFNLPAVGRRLAGLRKSLLATQPDLVISFIDTLNVQVLLALSGRQVPVIVSERVYPPSYSIGRRWDMLRWLTYPRAQAVVVQTEMTARWARARSLPWRVEVIPNAVPLPRIETVVRPSWFGDRNIVAMGRLAPQKNFSLLIAAFAAATRSRPEWHLTIAGEGPERQHLTELARSLDVGDRVHLPGVIRNPWCALGRADLFALTSNFEGFPNALAEAMARGLPVVATDCPTGPADIIRSQVDGLLVPTGDLPALTAAFSLLMADDAMRARLAARGPEICKRFSEEQVLSRWRDLLGRTLNSGGA